jgi:hypothetical protein
MGHLVERMQGELVAGGNRLDERRPVLLRRRRPGLGIEHVAQRCRRLLPTFLSHDRHIPHTAGILQILTGKSRSGWKIQAPAAPIGASARHTTGQDSDGRTAMGHKQS